MKFIWEEKDVVVGRRYSRSGIGEQLLIGFMASHNGPDNYVSISLNDGMVTKPRSRESMAGMLTDQEYVPVEILEALK